MAGTLPAIKACVINKADLLKDPDRLLFVDLYDRYSPIRHRIFLWETKRCPGWMLVLPCCLLCVSDGNNTDAVFTGPMVIQLQEIDDIISKFTGDDRLALSSYYVEISREKLEDPAPMKRQKICLLKDNLRYLPEKDHAKFVEEILSVKVLQTRALVLDLVCTNYSIEKQYIYKPENWIEAIVSDIFETFDLPADRFLFEEYNRQLCDEILSIFCSCERFNSAGNQLLLNIVMYKDRVRGYTDYSFDAMLKHLISRFNRNRCMGLTKIGSIYKEYKDNIARKKINTEKHPDI